MCLLKVEAVSLQCIAQQRERRVGSPSRQEHAAAQRGYYSTQTTRRDFTYLDSAEQRLKKAEEPTIPEILPQPVDHGEIQAANEAAAAPAPNFLRLCTFTMGAILRQERAHVIAATFHCSAAIDFTVCASG